MRIEFVPFDRPDVWETVGQSRRLVASSEGRVSKTPDGTRLHVRIGMEPRGALRLLSPLIGRTLCRRERDNLARIKAVREREETADAVSACRCESRALCCAALHKGYPSRCWHTVDAGQLPLR